MPPPLISQPRSRASVRRPRDQPPGPPPGRPDPAWWRWPIPYGKESFPGGSPKPGGHWCLPGRSPLPPVHAPDAPLAGIRSISGIISANSAAAIAPARTRRGEAPVTSTMVDGKPPGQGPASRIRSTSSPNSRRHLVRPDERPATGAIGAGAGNGKPQGGNQAAGKRLARLAHRDGPGAAGEPPVQMGRLGKMMAQGAGPKFLHKPPGQIRDLPSHLIEHLRSIHQQQHRLSRGPVFEGKDASQSLPLERVDCQPEKSFRGHRDDAVPLKDHPRLVPESPGGLLPPCPDASHTPHDTRRRRCWQDLSLSLSRAPKMSS